MKKALCRGGIGLLTVLVAAALYAGNFMCSYALLPEPHGVEDLPRTREKADSLWPGCAAWYDSLKVAGILKDTTVTGNGGYRVHACYVPAAQPESAQGTAVVVHGYTDNHMVFLYLVQMYRDWLNYNVLFPDLQYHGYSEGPAIQMGWLDRLDAEMWAGVAHDVFRNNFVVLHGVSMGAATVMMASGDPLPDYVGALVEDCGYSSVWEQFRGNLKASFGLPPFPVLHCASLLCKIRYGWGFREASSVKQLSNSTKPMLFIHGDADDFVPFENLQKNFDAKVTGYKKMWVAPGALHAASFLKYPQEYTLQVKEFLETVKAQ